MKQTVRPVGEMVGEAVRQPLELLGQAISIGVTLGAAIAPCNACDALQLIEARSVMPNAHARAQSIFSKRVPGTSSNSWMRWSALR